MGKWTLRGSQSNPSFVSDRGRKIDLSHLVARMCCVAVFLLLLESHIFGAAATENSESYVGVLGDRINYRTGELTLTKEDVTISGCRGLDIHILRHYSSTIYGSAIASHATDHAEYSVKDTSLYNYLGTGWSIEFPYIYDVGAAFEEMNSKLFLRHPDGTFEALLLNGDTLTKSRFPYRTTDGLLFKHISSADTALLPDGSRMVFGHVFGGGNKKSLTQLINITGDALSVTYHTGSRWVKKVTAPSGLWVDFRYRNSAGTLLDFDTIPSSDIYDSVRLDRLQYPNYRFDNSVDTLSILYGYDTRKNLTSVTYAGGRIERYTYTDSVRYDAVADYEEVNFDSLYDRTTPYFHKAGMFYLSSIESPEGAKAAFKYRSINLPLYGPCDGHDPVTSCGDTLYFGTCNIWSYRNYVAVNRRIADDSTVKFTYDICRNALTQRETDKIGSKTTVQLPGGGREEYFFFHEVSCDFDPSAYPDVVWDQSIPRWVFWPAMLYQQQSIYGNDTACTGYSYGRLPVTAGDTALKCPNWVNVGGRPIYWMDNGVERCDTLAQFQPPIRLVHAGVPYFEPDLYFTNSERSVTKATSRKRWVSSYNEVLPNGSAISRVSISKRRPAQSTIVHAPLGYWEKFAYFQPPVGYVSDTTDTLAFSIDSVTNWIYVPRVNMTLVTATKHVWQRDRGTYITYKYATYDTSVSYCPLISTKTKFDYATTGIADSFIVNYAYTANGQVKYAIGANGDTAFYEYDSLGRISKTVDSSLGATSTLVYYPDRKIKYSIGLNGDTTTYVYDHLGRDSLVILPLETGYSRRTIIDSGLITTSVKIDSNLYSTSKSYLDKYFRTVKSTVAAGTGVDIVDSSEYSSLGLLTKSMRARLSTDTTSPRVWANYTYDENDRVVKTILPDQSFDSVHIIDDYNSEVIGRRHAKNRSTVDFFGDVTIQYAFDTTGQMWDSTVRSYNSKGQVTQVTDLAGRASQFEYDLFGRTNKVTDPNRGVRRIWYNRRGQVRLMRANSDSQFVYFRYDPDLRLSDEGTIYNADTTQVNSSTYPTSGTSNVITYKYDSYSTNYWADTASGLKYCKGRLTEVVDGSGWRRYYYDLRGRIGLEADSIIGLGATKKMKYQYFANNAVKQITYPDSSVTSYTYTTSGNLKSVSQVVDSGKIVYEPWGALKSFDFRNGIKTRNYYDSLSQLTKSLNYRPNSKLFCRSYTWSKGLIREEKNLDTTGDTTISTIRSYTYDGIGRLDSLYITDPNGLASSRGGKYVYDKNCNFDIIRYSGLPLLRYKRYNGTDRDSLLIFASDSSYRYEYDSRGLTTAMSKYSDTTGSGSWAWRNEFTYDHRGLLTKVKFNLPSYETGQVAGEVYNTYDYAGRKVKQTWKWQTKQCSGGGGGEGPQGPDGPIQSCWYVNHQTDRYYVWSGGVVLREYEIVDGSPNNCTTCGLGDHVYGLGRRLATRLPNGGSDTVNLYVYDYLGNMKSYQTSTGGLYETNLEYYPYGSMYSRNGNGAGRYTFQAKENDHTLQADFGPRYFSPLAGRFLAPDLVRSSYSPYAYTPGNPIMMNDPSGMQASPATMAFLAARSAWWHEMNDPERIRQHNLENRNRQVHAEMDAERQARTDQFLNTGRAGTSSSGVPSGIEDNPNGFGGWNGNLVGGSDALVGRMVWVEGEEKSFTRKIDPNSNEFGASFEVVVTSTGHWEVAYSGELGDAPEQFGGGPDGLGKASNFAGASLDAFSVALANKSFCVGRNGLVIVGSDSKFFPKSVAYSAGLAEGARALGKVVGGISALATLYDIGINGDYGADNRIGIGAAVLIIVAPGAGTAVAVYYLVDFTVTASTGSSIGDIIDDSPKVDIGPILFTPLIR